MAALEIPRGFIKGMISHALEDDPNECCGVLLGKQGRVFALRRVTNVIEGELKRYRYEMAPGEFMAIEKEREEKGWDLWGIYHSHTHTVGKPSPTDQNNAKWPGAKELIFPGTYYLLVSFENMDKPNVRAFSIKERGVTEHEIRVIGSELARQSNSKRRWA